MHWLRRALLKNQEFDPCCLFFWCLKSALSYCCWCFILDSAMINILSAAPGTIFSYPSKIAGCGIGPKNVADWISAETLVETLFSFLLLLEWADVLLLFLDGWDLGIILEFVAGILQCHSHANEMWSNVICCMLTCGWFSERIWWHDIHQTPDPV